jgi:hypothetical protein
MGPPLSATPSIASFESFRSSSRNFEAERLSILLTASQAEHLNQREFYENRERSFLARFIEERKLYIEKIAELEARIVELEGGEMGNVNSQLRRF